MTEAKQGAQIISMEDFEKVMATVEPHQKPVSDEVFAVLEENALNFYNFILPELGAIFSFLDKGPVTEDSKKFIVEKGTRALRVYDLLLSQRAFPKTFTIQVTLTAEMHEAIENKDSLGPLHTVETALKALWDPEVTQSKDLQEKFVLLDYGNFSIKHIRQVDATRHTYNIVVDTVLLPKQYASGMEAHLHTPFTPDTIKGKAPFIHEEILKND